MAPEHKPEIDHGEAAAMRESVRREMLRTNTVVAVVLAVVLALSLAAVLSGARAARNQQRAEAAEAAGTERLWNAYLAQASALRLTATAGRKEKALDVISNAATIHSSLALRTEAAATLALADLKSDGPLVALPRGMDSTEMDAALKLFAYGDDKGIVHVAGVRDGKELFTLEARNAGPGLRLAARSTAFSPDSRYLCARYAGGALAVWDLNTRAPVFIVGAQATNVIIAGMTYTPDSRRLMFSDPDRDRQISILDLEKGELVATGIRVGARAFRFRPGTMQLALVSDGNVDLLEHPSETVLKTFPHPTRIYLVMWSPDGRQLAVACEDGDVYLWDVNQGTQRVLRGHSEPCIRLGFSPDGRLLFTGSRDGTTRLWDATTGLLILATEQSVAHTFSPDGQRMGYWQLSKAMGTWRVALSECYVSLRCAPEDGAFVSLDLSPDGRWVVATQTKGFRVWDLGAGNREKFFPVPGIQSVRIAPDKQSVFICHSNWLERWPVIETADSLTFGDPAKIPLPENAGARNIALSLDGGTAAVETTDAHLVVLDLRGTNAPVIFPERWRGSNQKGSASPTGPGRFALSPDGRWLCTGYWFGTKDLPRVWDAHTAKVVANPHMDTSLVTFSADGKWLGLAGVAEFQIFSTADWTRATKIKRDEPSFTHGSMAFLPDGSVALTRTRQLVQLREAFNEEKYLDLVAPVLQSVASLRVSTNGNVLATGSARDVIQVWRLDRLRAALNGVNLDWNQHKPVLTRSQADEPNWLAQNALVTFGGTGFVLVALLSLFTLRRHRKSIERFFAAEARTVERNRALEAAKIELMQSQKMQALGTLAAGIAHDFNNLLSVIRMSNKLIGRAVKDNADVQENVADIEQAVIQGKNVVGSMLGYARSENDSIGPLDLCSTVEETVSLLSKEFLSGIALTLELNRRAPQVNISRGQVEQMLLNLVVNASEAMAGKGKLKIAVRPAATLPAKHFVLRPEPAARFVELAVSDSGPGIPPEIRDRLFEPFFTTKRGGAKAGTGLGLSLVYSIAQQEQLGLNVESEPGKGAAFSIYFPLKTE